MSEQVYLKFGYDGDYFEIELDKNCLIHTELIDKMPVERKKWDEILIKNKPYKYRTEPTDANRLYTAMMQLKPTDYIFIKHVGNDEDVTEGYFGIIDCEIDNTEKKNIKVTPTILDQYTDLLEHRDTKVNVFGLSNLVKNGEFRFSNNGNPLNWEWEEGEIYLEPTVSYLLETSCALLKTKGYIKHNTISDDRFDGVLLKQAISLYGYTNFSAVQNYTVMYQEELPFRANNKIYLNFFYQLMERWNPKLSKNYIYMRISATDNDGSNLAYAQDDGKWFTTPTFLPPYLIVKSVKLPLPFDDINGFEYYSKILESLPFDGKLTITFYSVVVSGDAELDLTSVSDTENAYPVYENGGWVYYESDLILSKIRLESSPFEYKTIDVSLNSDRLVVKGTSQIYDENGYELAADFSAYLPKKEVDIIEESGTVLGYYFDDADNSPLIGRMGDDVMGFKGKGQSGNIYGLSDYIDIFNNANSDFYQGELCEVQIFQLERWDWIGLKRVQILRAEFKFAREEVYSTDVYTQEDEDLGLIPAGSSVGDPKPPALDENWFLKGNTNDNKAWLWVRKPFNNTISNWQITDEGGGYWHSQKYTAKRTARNVYPINEDSRVLTNTVYLKDIIKKVYNETHPSLADKELYSTFLFNDYPSDEKTAMLLDNLPILVEEPNTNYYTRNYNYLRDIACLHTYDLRTTKNVDDADAELFLTFKEMMDDLMIIFPYLYYFVDTDGNLHIEHLSYEDHTNELISITDYEKRYQTWKYNKNEMFAIIDYNCTNAGFVDFTLAKMEFDKIVSNRRSFDIRQSVVTKYFTSDIQYCFENPDNISNGLILVNYIDQEGNEKIRNGIGDISGTEMPNGNISIANMLRNFGTFEGTWKRGAINDREYRFKHTKWTMEGLDQIQLSGIQKNKYMLSDIGIGLIRSKTYDYRKGLTIVDLTYRYDETIIVVEENNFIKL